MQKIINYFKGVKQELKKVIWPTKKEASRLTVIVIVVAIFFGIFIGILDLIFTYLFKIFI